MRGRRSKHGLLGGFIALGVLGFVVFSPVLGFGFAYDDHWTVENDRALELPLAPLLRSLFSGEGLARRIPDATRPSMVASLWVDRRLFGPAPSGYHLDSLLLYAVSVIAAGFAVFSITRRRSSALVGATVFAVSPVHAEVVASVNYREDLLAGIAVLFIVAWLFAPRTKAVLLDHAVWIAALYVFGLLGKESASVLLPLVAAVLLAKTSPRRIRPWLASRVHGLTALSVAFVVWGAWRVWLRATSRDDVPLVLVHRGLGERVLRTARYCVRSFFDAVVPIHWSPDYAPEGSASAGWLLLLVAIVAVVFFLARSRATRALSAGLSIALVAPLATSPLLSPINERADRYVFLATLGGAVFWGALATGIGRRAWPFARARVALTALGIVTLALLARESRRAAMPWRSDKTLWLAATERAPLSPRAFTGFARTLRLAGRLDEADAAVERAIALDPTFLRARVTRVYNLLARGEVERARLEITDIERRGGQRQLGLRHARTCALLAPEAARRCIDSGVGASER